MANSKVWISKGETGSEPALDRIMDMREASDEKQKKRATSPPGTPISLPNNYLKIKALLSEATTAYLAQDYNHASYLFSRATQGNDEQLMEAYAGVYQSSMALGEQDKASEAYRKLIQISINNMNKLSTLFLFEVNKITFPKDHDLEDDFSIWLREIGHYLKNNDECFIIEGHSSKTGEAEYNRILSQRRAAEIQRRLQVYFPAVKQKTKIIGKGFDETIVGLGTDDAQDELDRRVEFEIIDCKELKNTDTLSL